MRMVAVVAANTDLLPVFQLRRRFGKEPIAPIMPVRVDGSRLGMSVAIAAIARLFALFHAAGRKGYDPIAPIMPRRGNDLIVFVIAVVNARVRKITGIVASRFPLRLPFAPLVPRRGNRAVIEIIARFTGAGFRSFRHARGRDENLPFVPIVPRRGEWPRFGYVGKKERNARLHAFPLAGSFDRRNPFAERGVFGSFAATE